MDYFELLTDVPDKELAEFRQALAGDTVNPMEIKKRLGREIVAQLYDWKAAGEAEEQFTKVFQKKEKPETIQEHHISFSKITSKQGDKEFIDVSQILVETGLAQSRSEANRLISQGGTVIADEVVDNRLWPKEKVQSGSIIKVGKRRFAKVINTDILNS